MTDRDLLAWINEHRKRKQVSPLKGMAKEVGLKPDVYKQFLERFREEGKLK